MTCRLSAKAPVPAWAAGEFVSVSRSADELSIVCRETEVPDEVEWETGWRCLKFAGKLDLAMVGVLAGVTGVLAEEGACVFAMSTFQTDYLLVKETDLDRSLTALGNAGYDVTGREDV